jgi:hypothetical protein
MAITSLQPTAMATRPPLLMAIRIRRRRCRLPRAPGTAPSCTVGRLIDLGSLRANAVMPPLLLDQLG